jgi:hypothetical protein
MSVLANGNKLPVRPARFSRRLLPAKIEWALPVLE